MTRTPTSTGPCAHASALSEPVSHEGSAALHRDFDKRAAAHAPSALTTAGLLLALLHFGPASTAHGQAPGSEGVNTDKVEDFAAPPESQEHEDGEYEALIKSALAAYDVGQWASARRDFRRAHELKPSARTLRTIGMCDFNLGDFAGAAVVLEQALESADRPLSAEQRKQAQSLVERSLLEVAELRLTVLPVEGLVLVDGQAPKRLKSGVILLAPGDHMLQLHGGNHPAQQRQVTCVAGQKLVLTIELGPELVAATPRAAGAGTAPAASSSSLPTTLGVTALVGGGLSLSASLVVALLANAKVDDLQDRCPARTCPESASEKLATYDAFRTVSTVTFYAGLGLGLAGAVLLLWPSEQSAEPSDQVAVSVSPFHIALGGAL